MSVAAILPCKADTRGSFTHLCKAHTVNEVLFSFIEFAGHHAYQESGNGGSNATSGNFRTLYRPRPISSKTSGNLFKNASACGGCLCSARTGSSCNSGLILYLFMIAV